MPLTTEEKQELISEIGKGGRKLRRSPEPD